MVTKIKVELDFEGIGEILRSPDMAAAVHELAQSVADNVDAQGLVAVSAGDESPSEITATVEDSTTDRAVSTVRITHPAAIAMQAKHGVLTRAAAAAGLEVKT